MYCSVLECATDAMSLLQGFKNFLEAIYDSIFKHKVTPQGSSLVYIKSCLCDIPRFCLCHTIPCLRGILKISNPETYMNKKASQL